MKITKRQLRNIIAEALGDQLPYSRGGPWVDKDAPVGRGASQYDDLDTELTDEEIETSMGWDQTAGDDAEYNRGYQDGLDGVQVAQSATADYDIGYEDGKNDATLPAVSGEAYPEGSAPWWRE